jgi:hypothetical protein
VEQSAESDALECSLAAAWQTPAVVLRLATIAIESALLPRNPKEIDLSLGDFERSQTVHASHFLHYDGPPSLRLPVRPR